MHEGALIIKKTSNSDEVIRDEPNEGAILVIMNEYLYMGLISLINDSCAKIDL
ncbi:hypothetical protein Scep_027208 [Stephania cephalantha]|uniref:Uncharacterized protein n=1 Tax=Stephania cephalantha TaxID=152367 RepID=A0AAP0HKV9_9MAGN